MKRILTIIAAVALSLCAFAQQQDGTAPDHKKHHERFQAEKVAFLTNAMDLTVEESQAFWPIYNEYSKASDAAHHTVMKALEKVRRDKELTDEEAAQAVADLVAARSEEAALTAKYTEEFKKVLPIKKVAALFAAEEGFRQHLFRKFKDGGPEKPGKPGKPGPRKDESMRRQSKGKAAGE